MRIRFVRLNNEKMDCEAMQTFMRVKHADFAATGASQLYLTQFAPTEYVLVALYDDDSKLENGKEQIERNVAMAIDEGVLIPGAFEAQLGEVIWSMES